MAIELDNRLVLQCVAVCCSVLQCVAVCCNRLTFEIGRAKVHSNGKRDL